MIRYVQGMVPRLSAKNREVVSVYIGYPRGMEVIQRTATVDFRGLRSSAARAMKFTRDEFSED
jgi:hypothetical protein